MTQYATPIYGVTYADDLEPLANYPALTQAAATSIEAALKRGGIAPPAAQDLAALAGRVTTLEGRALASLRQSVSIPASIPAGAYTIIGWDTADVDTAGGFSKTRTGASATSDTRWTVPAGQAGIYRVQAILSIGVETPGGTGVARIRRNGAVVAGSAGVLTAGASQVLSAESIPRLITLAVGDYVEAEVYSDAASPLRVTPADGIGSAFIIERMK